MVAAHAEAAAANCLRFMAALSSADVFAPFLSAGFVLTVMSEIRHGHGHSRCGSMSEVYDLGRFSPRTSFATAYAKLPRRWIADASVGELR